MKIKIGLLALIMLFSVPTARSGRTRDTFISSVVGELVTVRTGKVTQSYRVSNFTEITVNGQPAALADLKKGMRVDVSIGLDPKEARRIVAQGP